MRPVALEVGTGDFIFVASRRRIAISLLAGTLIPRAALSILIFAGEETLRLPEMRAR
jgi:hypothetical protein